jgi:hypothetical protein
MLCNSRNAKRIVCTSISDSLVGDDHFNRCDDGGLSALSAVRTEGSFPPSISPFPAFSPGGVSPWGRWRSAVRHAIHSREPILVGHHPLNCEGVLENRLVSDPGSVLYGRLASSGSFRSHLSKQPAQSKEASSRPIVIIMASSHIVLSIKSDKLDRMFTPSLLQ